MFTQKTCLAKLLGSKYIGRTWLLGNSDVGSAPEECGESCACLRMA